MIPIRLCRDDGKIGKDSNNYVDTYIPLWFIDHILLINILDLYIKKYKI
jgi:hypothetical protein